jgi:hypothetical protein
MIKKKILDDMKWTMPAGLILGALLSVFQHDFYLSAWLAFSLVSFFSMWILAGLWRWAGGGRTLAIIITIAFAARLIGGVALNNLLPVFGNPNNEQKSGYVFYDAFKRDTEAWSLAHSSAPIWSAVGNPDYASDQYGGLLALSALSYRYLLPQSHLPALIVLLAAFAGAIAIPFAFKSICTLWSERVAYTTIWILALYPESVLLGSAQMREPFLIAFICISMWGFVEWQSQHDRAAWGWFALGIAGLLLFSPGIALLCLVVFGVWQLVGGIRSRTSWVAFGTIGIVFVLGIFLLASVLSRSTMEVHGGGPLNVIATWLFLASDWDMQHLAQGSGIVQYFLKVLPQPLQTPFLISYGVTQPLLPAALIEPTVFLWRIISTLRAAGWYLLLPMLFYGVFVAVKTTDEQDRPVLLWLELVIWIWIILVSARAGADQWDNPRYRVIMLPWQAIVVAYAWHFWREHRDRWLPRIIAVEIAFLLPVLAWYAGRYYALPKTSVFVYLAVALVAGILIVAGDMAYQHWRKLRQA